MASQRGWRVFLCSFLLLIGGYAVYFVRYPMWRFSTIEPLFALLNISYLVILIGCFNASKKDISVELVFAK
jgi:hypothetical protein